MEPVTLESLLAQHGTREKIAEALGVTRQAVHVWFKQGRLPELWQYRLSVPGATWERRKKYTRRQVDEAPAARVE